MYPQKSLDIHLAPLLLTFSQIMLKLKSSFMEAVKQVQDHKKQKGGIDQRNQEIKCLIFMQ